MQLQLGQVVDKYELGERITKARNKKGWNKAQLANEVAVTDVAIGFWEAGKINEIGHLKLIRLAAVLEVSLESLLDVRYK